MLPIYDDNVEEEFVPETQNLDEDENEDYVEEEELEDEGEAGDDPKPERKGGKADRQNWTKKQEEALAKAYVHCSLNKTKGNQQKLDGFWKKVLEHYNATVGGSTQTVHQVRSKWKPMQGKLNLFNGFWHQADRLRHNGSDDTYVRKQALKDYQKRHRGGFPHVEAWEVVRKHEKKVPIPLLGEDSSSSGGKRKSLVIGWKLEREVDMAKGD
ncbi:glutathione S-transferase T3-like [Helianthus annuus]|uniref:glutathione S-transferase T3-like n=1 Tax=Helianthus annuus TaxID=4232 RepID=UPI000B8F314F|nr:glutathione S-transferase T3-like [Helianthus annuus]